MGPRCAALQRVVRALHYVAPFHVPTLRSGGVVVSRDSRAFVTVQRLARSRPAGTGAWIVFGFPLRAPRCREHLRAPPCVQLRDCWLTGSPQGQSLLVTEMGAGARNQGPRGDSGLFPPPTISSGTPC